MMKIISNQEIQACRSSLATFFSFAMRHTNIAGGEPFMESWHIDYMCWEMQKTITLPISKKMQMQGLVCNLPPRHTKSLLASVVVPAWYIGRFPSHSVICIAGSKGLARNFSTATRLLMEDENYLRIFPEAQIVGGAKDDYYTAYRGARIEKTVASNILGRNGDLCIIDDPDDSEVVLRSHRDRIYSMITQCVETRGVRRDPGQSEEGTPNQAVLIVQQRMHIDDASGQTLRRCHPDGSQIYRHISIPLVAEQDISYEWKDLRMDAQSGKLKWVNCRKDRMEGDIINEKRVSKEEAASYKYDSMQNDDGEKWNNMYQQNPKVKGGMLFNPYLFFINDSLYIDHTSEEYNQYLNGRLFHGRCGLELKNMHKFILMDFAYSVNETADYTAIIVLGAEPSSGYIHILDIAYERLHITESCELVVKMAKMYSEHMSKQIFLLIENNQSQTHLDVLTKTQMSLGFRFDIWTDKSILHTHLKRFRRPQDKYSKIASLRSVFKENILRFPKEILSYDKYNESGGVIDIMKLIREEEYLKYALSPDAINGGVRHDDFLDALSLICQINYILMLNIPVKNAINNTENIPIHYT